MLEFDRLSVMFPDNIKTALFSVSEKIKENAMEIRIIKDFPLFLTMPKGRIYLDKNGNESSFSDALKMTEKDISEISLKITDYSFYAHEKDIKNGFVTLKGGYRVGLSGNVGFTDISSLSFRISKEIVGSSDELFSELGTFENTVILSPPCCGKTTILRDIARRLSLEKKTVSIIDTREEISMGKGSYYGCDVLFGFPKKEGIMHSLRFLSPEYIICDEITSMEELFAISEGLYSGVKFIVTAHSKDLFEAKKRNVTRELLSFFDTAVFLEDKSKIGKLKEVVKLD